MGLRGGEDGAHERGDQEGFGRGSGRVEMRTPNQKKNLCSAYLRESTEQQYDPP